MTNPTDPRAPSLGEIEQTLAFFRSVIKSGEPWTPACEEAYQRAASHLREIAGVLATMPEEPPREPPPVDELMEDMGADDRDDAWQEYGMNCGAFVSRLRRTILSSPTAADTMDELIALAAKSVNYERSAYMKPTEEHAPDARLQRAREIAGVLADLPDTESECDDPDGFSPTRYRDECAFIVARLRTILSTPTAQEGA